MKAAFVAVAFSAFLVSPVMAEEFVTDTFDAMGTPLKITFVGHATLMITYGDRVIHIDPVNREADYTTMPKADLILITHEHGDHLDPNAIASIRKPTTVVLTNESVASKLDATVIRNGESLSVLGIRVEAVPAYNTTPDRERFHPKSRDNGYVLTFADKRVYVAGDTENIPEMADLHDIDIAFLPMNQPYTMTPQQVASAARAFKPKILYPYHFGDTDVTELQRLLGSDRDIEIRVRDMS